MTMSSSRAPAASACRASATLTVLPPVPPGNAMTDIGRDREPARSRDTSATCSRRTHTPAKPYSRASAQALSTSFTVASGRSTVWSMRGASSSGLRIGSPGDEWREAHEDRLDVSARAQAEESAAVVDQVELDVSPAPAELLRTVVLGVRQRAAPLRDRRVGGQERVPDVAQERPALVAAQVVEEDPAHAALVAAVLDEEVVLRPA